MSTEPLRASALITGAGKRIGAEIAKSLHREGYNITLHYRHSATEAQTLAKHFNQARENSAICIQADLNNMADVENLAKETTAHWQGLDVLINNASSFYPTPIGQADEQQWDELINSNLKAPFFLSQALAPSLRKTKGCIINIADIYAKKPLAEHSIYCIAKAGNVMLTKSLAKELAPDIRVNGIAPGAILWPENENTKNKENDTKQQDIIESIPSGKTGTPENICQAVSFLSGKASYITGQILNIDGGRNLNI